LTTVLAGGVGAARFLRGLVQATEPSSVTAIVNVGDDTVLHGLHISPDIDTVTYTLAGAINPETGWGLRDETWQAMDMVERYGGPSWFRLGDRDLGTHLYRTGRLSEGAPLSTVTAEIASSWGLEVTLVPATDDRLRTMVTVEGEGEIGFQDYFVGRQHSVPITGVRFAGIESARPGPGVLDAVAGADVVVVAPSNPVVSIGPLLAVPGVRDQMVARRADVVAVSPIIGGRAIKGPADRMLGELGVPVSAAGVARWYRDVAATIVIDAEDEALAAEVEEQGVRSVVTDTIMSSPERAAALARVVIGQ
jgi:LPPG:FO 2-phospho-L-lactate transferase